MPRKPKKSTANDIKSLNPEPITPKVIAVEKRDWRFNNSRNDKKTATWTEVHRGGLIYHCTFSLRMTHPYKMFLMIRTPGLGSITYTRDLGSMTDQQIVRNYSDLIHPAQIYGFTGVGINVDFPQTCGV